VAAEFLIPDWPAPPSVKAMQTTRHGGVSQAPWASLNLGDHVGDDPRHVILNRQHVRAHLLAEPAWLQQVHGTAVLMLPAATDIRIADAACTRRPGQVCVVMTADCLPILLCDRQGTVVAALHAGWRGLCAGVIESTVAAMAVPGELVLAWLGPAIGPDAFEVGEEVRAAFVALDGANASCFKPSPAGRWLADIYGLARRQLRRLGVSAVYGGEFCTFGESERFFSYRRESRTGRMATLIWLG